MTVTRYGLLAEFATAAEVTAAAQSAYSQGYRCMDAYTPFPVEGLDAALGFRPRLLPYLAFLGGLGGACMGYFMQYFTSVHHYPLIVAGRPFHSWPSFVPLTFELAILGAALMTLLALMIGNRLPEPHHPLFNIEAFERASQDRFFLCIEARDRRFDVQQTRHHLEALHPAAIYEVND
jgi:hypothetical protein